MLLLINISVRSCPDGGTSEVVGSVGLRKKQLIDPVRFVSDELTTISNIFPKYGLINRSAIVTLLS